MPSAYTKIAPKSIQAGLIARGDRLYARGILLRVLARDMKLDGRVRLVLEHPDGERIYRTFPAHKYLEIVPGDTTLAKARHLLEMAVQFLGFGNPLRKAIDRYLEDTEP